MLVAKTVIIFYRSNLQDMTNTIISEIRTEGNTPLECMVDCVHVRSGASGGTAAHADVSPGIGQTSGLSLTNASKRTRALIIQ